MAPRCCVTGCKSNSLPRRKCGNIIPSFTFPKDEVIRNKWIEALGKKDWAPKKYSTICIRHFRPEDVQHNLMLQNEETQPDLARSKLLNGAVPSRLLRRPVKKEMEEEEMINQKIFCLACNFVTEPKNSTRKFFSLPRIRERRKIWLEKLDRCDLIGKNISRDNRVCEIHFLENSIDKRGHISKDVDPIEVVKNNTLFEEKIDDKILNGSQQNIVDSKILQEVEKDPEFSHTDSKILQEVEKDPESSQTVSSGSTKISKIPEEKNNAILIKNECLLDIEEDSNESEIDLLIPIKEEIEATPYRIEENLNLPTTFPEVAALKTCGQKQDLPVKIMIKSIDDSFQTNACVVKICKTKEANKKVPLISAKEKVQENSNLPEGKNVETSSMHDDASQKVDSVQNKKGKSTVNKIQRNLTGSRNGERRKRKRSHEEEKNVDCENCGKLLKECSQILEKVKICADTIESIVQSNKILNDSSIGKIELVEKVKENNINLFKQIKTLKTEIDVFNFTHCSLNVSTNDN
ncbi:uncharacterized protein LOC129618448 [Condylostylus longicornis]|uniref:uncharacterized protein LOC129618448 n=1 Tax=Condylostylus longicornis TaxID=2530218 RepID=UPI00244DFA11|nr:uncharacterized protein LOC129618448 [Condylostylus longicornis]XP_055389170.1 uncharacterized protein LOC129618448 [Condylostylus longicornis]